MRYTPFRLAKKRFEKAYFASCLDGATSYADGAQRAKLDTSTFWRYCQRHNLKRKKKRG